ncbi:MAG: hypothetical protein AVDCRST_MAG23-63, partial [uncultured Sphingosinicella sp.]
AQQARQVGHKPARLLAARQHADHRGAGGAGRALPLGSGTAGPAVAVERCDRERRFAHLGRGGGSAALRGRAYPARTPRDPGFGPAPPPARGKPECAAQPRHLRKLRHPAARRRARHGRLQPLCRRHAGRRAGGAALRDELRQATRQGDLGRAAASRGV